MAENIELRRLSIKAFHMNEVAFGDENVISQDGKWTFKEDMSEYVKAHSEVIEDIKLQIIMPGEHDRHTNAIMDIIPLSTKVLGKRGEGITHTITGVYIMPTGVDTEGEQVHEFGSANGNLKDMLYLNRAGTPADDDKDQSAWSLINMRQLIETNFISVREGDKLRHLVEAIKNSKRNLFPVLTEDNKFLGVIHMDGVRSIIFQPELYDTVGVEELMFPVTDGDIVHLSDSPQEVVAKFHLKNKYNLIVLDDDGTYVGILSRANVFSAYRRFVRDVSEE